MVGALSSANNNMTRLLRFYEFVPNSDGKRRRSFPMVLAKQACMAMKKKGMWRFRFIPPSLMAATKKYEDSDDEEQFGEVDDVPPILRRDAVRLALPSFNDTAN